MKLIYRFVLVWGWISLAFGGDQLSERISFDTWQGSGPLVVGERNPLFNLFYVPHAEQASPLPQGQWLFEVGNGYANIFERSGNLEYFEELDLEMVTTEIAFRRGLKNRWEIGGRVPFHSFFGGALDHFIEEFHDTLSLPNDTRDERPQNAYNYLFFRYEGPVYAQVGKQQFEPGGPTFFVKYGLNSRNPMSLRATIKAPLGDDALDSGKTDVALEFLGATTMGRTRFHAMASLFTLNAPDHWDGVNNDAALFLSATLERPWRGLSLLVQLDGSTPYFRNTGLTNLDDPTTNLILGVAGRSGKTDWQVSFAEDITGQGPAVDFTLALHLKRRP